MIALVTGSARGIGKATALHLASLGYTVIVHYHTSQAAAQAVLQDIQQTMPASRMLQADLTHETDIERLFKAIQQHYGRLDVLVNTVGNFGSYHPVSAVSAAEFDNVIQTNVRATLLCMQHAMPLLKAAGKARIINVGCATADQIIARKYTVPYYIAKAGVITLTKSYAELLAGDGITVNVVSPGIVENSIATTPLPMGRPAQFADITSAIAWLLSPQAAYVSGANLEIAGGWAPHK